MNKYTKHIIMVKGFPVKVYVTDDNQTAYLFFCFGRFARLRSDVNALDFATDYLFGKPQNNVISFQAYKSSQEDTAVINIAA